MSANANNAVDSALWDARIEEMREQFTLSWGHVEGGPGSRLHTGMSLTELPILPEEAPLPTPPRMIRLKDLPEFRARGPSWMEHSRRTHIIGLCKK